MSKITTVGFCLNRKKKSTPMPEIEADDDFDFSSSNEKARNQQLRKTSENQTDIITAATPPTTATASVDFHRSWNRAEDSNRNLYILLKPLNNPGSPVQHTQSSSSSSSAAPAGTAAESSSASYSSTECGVVLYSLHVHTLLLRRSSFFDTMLNSRFSEASALTDIYLSVQNHREGRMLYLLLFCLYTSNVFHDSEHLLPKAEFLGGDDLDSDTDKRKKKKTKSNKKKCEKKSGKKTETKTDAKEKRPLPLYYLFSPPEPEDVKEQANEDGLSLDDNVYEEKKKLNDEKWCALNGVDADVESGLSVKVRNSVVTSVNVEDLLLFMCLADQYAMIPICVQLVLPVFHFFLTLDQTGSLLLRVFSLPEGVLHHTASGPLLSLVKSHLQARFKDLNACQGIAHDKAGRESSDIQAKIWLSLPAAAVCYVLESPRAAVLDETTALDSVCEWLTAKWVENGGMSSTVAQQNMCSAEVVKAHTEILTWIRWFQLPASYVVQIILPRFKQGQCLAHLPSLQLVAYDVLSGRVPNELAMSGELCRCQNLSTHPDSRCLRDLYNRMSDKRRVSTCSLNFEFANVTRNMLTPINSAGRSWHSTNRFTLSGIQFGCVLWVENAHLKLMLSSDESLDLLHYCVSLLLQLDVWNWQTLEYNNLHKNKVVRVDGYDSIYLFDNSSHGGYMLAEQVLENAEYVRDGKMKVRMLVQEADVL